MTTKQETKTTNDTTYQSFGGRYYESKHDWNKAGYEPTIQRRLEVELTHFSNADSETRIQIEDCISGYKWAGSLKDLIAQLVKGEVANEGGENG